MRKHALVLSRLTLLLGSAALLLARTKHRTPFTGTWKLNLAKSWYDPGPPLQSTTETYGPDGVFTMGGTNAQGKSFQYSYPWSDGKEVPVNGVENTTVLWKVQGHTSERMVKIGGKLVRRVHAVSPDGRTMTETVEATITPGRPEHQVQVYDKQ